MRLVFVYGEVASGKLTVAREVAARTGFALFHNHLVVDAVAALFPFGSAEFVAARERLWLDLIGSAAMAGRSLVFTFAPEPTVAADFPDRVRTIVQAAGGDTLFVALTVDPAAQEQRLAAADRAAFGKLRSLDLLRALKPEFARCFAAMPAADLVIDTQRDSPAVAADAIVTLLDRRG